MRIRKCLLNRVKYVGWSAANLYEDDLDYLEQHGIARAWALRTALHEYILTLKSKTGPDFHAMTKAECDAWVMVGDARLDRIPPAPPTATTIEIPQIGGPVPDMTGWTREERGAWILSEGKTIPDRAMIAKKARSRV